MKLSKLKALGCAIIYIAVWGFRRVFCCPFGKHQMYTISARGATEGCEWCKYLEVHGKPTKAYIVFNKL